MSCNPFTLTNDDGFTKEQLTFDSVNVEILKPDYLLDFRYSTFQSEHRIWTVKNFRSNFAKDTLTGMSISYLIPTKEFHLYKKSLEEILYFLEKDLSVTNVDAITEKSEITTINGRDFATFKYFSDIRPDYYTVVLYTKVNTDWLIFSLQAFQFGYYTEFKQDIPKIIKSIKVNEL